jgi:hypothetical protein
MGRKALTLLGLALILAGCLALVYREISYTKREKVLDVGSLEATMDREKSIPIPPVVGWGMVGGGVVLVLAGARKPS